MANSKKEKFIVSVRQISNQIFVKNEWGKLKHIIISVPDSIISHLFGLSILEMF